MINKQTKTTGVGAKLAVGASIAAVSAAAYLLFGPNGKKNRKIIKGWSVKMKGEIIEKLEEAKDITEPVYQKIVDQVYSKYAKLKNIDKAELEEVILDIKKHWNAMSKTTKAAKRKVVSKAK